MKKKSVLIPMISSWFIFIALDSVLELFRTGYMRKTNKPVRFFIKLINSFRILTIFIIAILNFILAVFISSKKKNQVNAD